MPRKSKRQGTLLYPGVILYGDNIVINPGPSIPKGATKLSAKPASKRHSRKTKTKDGKFINLLVED